MTLHIDYREKQHKNFNGIICINENQLEKAKNFKGSKKLIYNWTPEIQIKKTSKFEIIMIIHKYTVLVRFSCRVELERI